MVTASVRMSRIGCALLRNHQWRSRWCLADVPWLLVLDNVDDPKLVASRLPSTDRGSILMTVRNTSPLFTTATKTQIVEPLSFEDSATLFMSQLALDRDMADKTSEDDHQAVRELCKELGGLPLAVTQVAGGSVHAEERVRVHAYYELTMSNVWDVTFSKLKDSTRDLLDIVAFLDPDSIPEQIFEVDSHILSQDPELSFLKSKAQSWPSTTKRVVTSGTVSNSSSFFTTRPGTCSRGAGSAISCPTRTWLSKFLRDIDEAQSLQAGLILNTIGSYHIETFDPPNAVEQHLQVLQIRQKLLPPGDPVVSNILHNLAIDYGAMGDYAKAKKHCEAALAIRENLPPTKHNVWYQGQCLPKNYTTHCRILFLAGELAEAETVGRKAVAKSEETETSEHIPTTDLLTAGLPTRAYCTLAEVLHELGKTEEALEYHLKSLKLRRDLLGDHYHTAASCYKLGLIYKTSSLKSSR
ncbi:hypothetical protein B0T16DRAFT_395525 [Cercophora newfieldiana]|uniref:DUF7779 domain-containing protein n=1 Tax=Cercophora newfieldiana TaxID=92897 RepID=A0AA40CIN7_9PEZI|nr:hypothetical protein B0T16DRAFT_395525 [Cercophora newfieldiana]